MTQPHPHLHFLVPGGALSEDGQQWLPSRADFFVPVHAASRRFRDLLLERLTAAGLTDDVRQQVAAIDWVVHCQPVGDGRRALRYLAPYVYRVAISNRRLLKCEPGPDGLGRVTFSYRRKGARRWRPMTVTASEFLRRFLQHVLPRGFQKVRHFGFVHPRHRADREWLKMLVTVTLNEIYVLLVAAAPLRVPYRPTCPQCGGPLTCVGFLAASAWPFVSYDTS